MRCPSGNSACKQGPCWWLGGGAALAARWQRRQASRTRPRQAPFLQPARHDSSTQARLHRRIGPDCDVGPTDLASRDRSMPA